MKRAITGALTLVGLVLVILAVMGVVLLGSKGTWRSAVSVPAGRSAVVVDPALAAVMGPRISVRADVADPADDNVQLFIGRARPDDTRSLLESTDRFLVTGMDGARGLATSHLNGNDLLPAPGSVDIWQSSAAAAGSAALSYQARPGAETVVITRADGKPLPALTLRLGWSRVLWYWVPTLLLLAGLGAIVLAMRMRAPSRPPRRFPLPATRHPKPKAAAAASTTSRSSGKPQHVGRRRATPANGRRR
ncbi:hypothetical protein ACPPVT_15215 [Angustibacter sp. McL0619]|uniref:hypothetical protein n=1 Tax=Angustibacter sp. McL0619 TaxID=3415676 RepID=UPI003CF17AFA